LVAYFPEIEHSVLNPFLSMRKSGIWIALVALVLIAVGIGAKPGYGLFKEWRSDRVAKEALGLYLENFREPLLVKEALEKAQAALELHREGFVPNRVMGTILTSIAPSNALLHWEQAAKSREIERWELDDEIAYIQCLLALRRAQDARDILQRLDRSYPDNIEVLHNLAKTSVLLGDQEEALRYARSAADHPASTPDRKLLYVRLCLNSENPSLRRQGELYLERLLEREGDLELPVLWALFETPNLSEALLRELSMRLRSKISSPEDGLILATMEVRSGLIDRRKAYEQLISEFNWESNEHRAVIATWCSDLGMPEQALQHMSMEWATGNADYFLTWIKALGSVGRWQDVLDGLSHRDSPLERFWLHYLTAEAHAALGQQTGAVNQWHRAKSALPATAEAYWLLLALADRLGLSSESDALASDMIPSGVNPSEIAAYYVGQAGIDGDYERLVAQLNRLRLAAPESPEALNDWAYYALLVSPTVDEQTLQAAEQLSNEHPTVLRYHMTWALGMIRQGKPEEVLGRFQQFQLQWETLHPKWRFILALALIHAGEEEQGRHYLNANDIEQLNPMEQQLLTTAMNGKS
jgi:tetratricopeptide (TPR) repeat protein